jgi:hypothetical protein
MQNQGFLKLKGKVQQHLECELMLDLFDLPELWLEPLRIFLVLDVDDT